jgi:hypothetical protein
VIPIVPGKPELADNDPDKISQLLELQLAQKRANWKRANARYRSIRSVSFLFLFILILGALLAFFFAFSRINEERGSRHPAKGSSASGR